MSSSDAGAAAGGAGGLSIEEALGLVRDEDEVKGTGAADEEGATCPSFCFSTGDEAAAERPPARSTRASADS